MTIRAAASILACLLVVMTRPVLGDEIAYVAAYACDPDRGRFSLMADVDTNDARAGVFAPEDERDIRRVVSGSEELRCTWDGVEIATAVGVWSPETGNVKAQGVHDSGRCSSMTSSTPSSLTSCMTIPTAPVPGEAVVGDRAYEGRWALIPELSFRDAGSEAEGIESILTIEVEDQNVRVRSDTAMPGDVPRSTEIGGILDGSWQPIESGGRKSFADLGGSALEYSLLFSDVSMFHRRWQVSRDGTLLSVARRTFARRRGGRIVRLAYIAEWIDLRWSS